MRVLASTERSVVLELFLSDFPALHALLCENAPSALAQDWDKWRSEKPLHYSGIDRLMVVTPVIVRSIVRRVVLN